MSYMESENFKMNENFEIRRRRINCVIPVWPLQHDTRLSLQAKGLLCLLLSFPEAWNIRMHDIIRRSKNGRDATRSAVNELVQKGYLIRGRNRDPITREFTGYSYIVCDEPQEP